MGSESDQGADSKAAVLAKRTTRIGVALSAAYAVALAIYISHDWCRVVAMEPNEIGDFLAGIFGPLALFWLVCGYFQQGAELRQNTAALRLQSAALEQQVQELKLSVEHQSSLAEAATKQYSLQKSEIERMQEAERKKYAPQPLITHFSGYSSSARGIFDFAIKNNGADVVIVDLSSAQVQGISSPVRKWGVGETFQVQLMKPRGFVPGNPITIIISYRHEMGQEGKVELVFNYSLAAGKYIGPVIVSQLQS